ncbi:hypothetical protein H5410_017164 [Solanum commersonii]|uniref:Uncharacterized protein n=1 Tax=Solanum commersonii TaxID=4109 RepID=A0A9J5ZZK0_SOLCO|nr:hypothetical protein H5410_017164 [Solanum commersonii]
MQDDLKAGAVQSRRSRAPAFLFFIFGVKNNKGNPQPLPFGCAQLANHVGEVTRTRQACATSSTQKSQAQTTEPPEGSDIIDIINGTGGLLEAEKLGTALYLLIVDGVIGIKSNSN